MLLCCHMWRSTAAVSRGENEETKTSYIVSRISFHQGLSSLAKERGIVVVVVHAAPGPAYLGT